MPELDQLLDLTLFLPIVKPDPMMPDPRFTIYYHCAGIHRKIGEFSY